jgi:DNA-directed RNA polymerase specialized sigma24 family protein
MKAVLARQEERAFERVYQRHVGDVYRYALVVLSDERDAEDVTATIFRNAYHGFRHGGRPRPELNGLLTIAHDVCRRRDRHAGFDDSFLVEDELEARRLLRRGLQAAMTCRDVELAVSRQLDGELPRRDRKRLRHHLGSCDSCGTIARGQRARRAALRALAAVPLPASLETFCAERKIWPVEASL